jgi:hypothetical protein
MCNIALRILFKPACLYGCLICLLTFVTDAVAQQGRDNQKKGSTMRAARWWIGLKTGIHYAEPVVSKSYQVFSSTVSTAPDDPQYAKKYDKRFSNRGYQVGLLAGFAITPNIALVTQPGFTNSSFGFRNTYAWSDTSGTLSIEQVHRVTISAVEVPLLLRLSWSFKKLQVYGHAGGYYGWIINASKTVVTSQLETEGENTLTFDGGTQTAGVKAMMAPSWKGLVGGGGISYDVDYVRIGLECNYQFGLDNRNNPNNRFTENRLITGSYDVPDDYQLRNLEFSLVLSMPLDNLIHLKKNTTEPRKKRRMGSPSF